MQYRHFLSICLFALLSMFACNKAEKISYPPTDFAESALIPLPFQMESTHSGFGLDKNTTIHVNSSDKEFQNIASYLADKISDVTGFSPKISSTRPKKGSRLIYIHQTENLASNHPEAYSLRISNDSLILESKSAEGAFRGIQTIRQLIPTTSNDTLAKQPIYVIPTGTIHDQPVFEYRGAMLDVARHFFSVDEVKRYIDQLAYYKYNRFHMHLSDDQGWRIEIKSWPKLTEVGAQSEVGGGPGGFYTQEDFKELVTYAAERYIQIIPEIDMPGHTNAASFSYPILNGNGKELEYYTGTHVGFSTWDAQKDTVYKFLDDVIREIAAISPSPYFHIGGDESHVTKKADYLHFIPKVEEIVNRHGKTMIGWNEIAQADLLPTTVAQLWNEPHNALKAAEGGSKIILSPAKKAYLDMQYDSTSIHGLHWAAYIPVDSAYLWDPATYVEGLKEEQILGLEAPLWSETISNSAELEYLAFPRAIGYGELGWTPSHLRNWDSYSNRLAGQSAYLKRENISYYPSKKINWQ